LKKILLIHNFYSKNIGSGENYSFLKEYKFLSNNKNFIIKSYTVNSDELIKKKIKLLFYLLISSFNFIELFKIRRIIKKFEPDIVYVFNTYPFISPSVFYSLSNSKSKIIFKLPNYRLFCVSSNFYRNNNQCFKCKTNLIYGIYHQCFRDSFLLSAMNSLIIALHKKLNTYSSKIDVAILLTDYQRKIFSDLKFKKIEILSNVVDDSFLISKNFIKKNQVLFVGRFTEEKGLDTILDCWSKNKNLPKLILAGNGKLLNKYNISENVEHHGNINNKNISYLYGESKLTIFASKWIEPFGTVILESLATGTPVLFPKVEWLPSNFLNLSRESYFESSNSEDLYNQISKILNNERLYYKILNEQKMVYEKFYSNEVRNKKLLNILNNLND